MDVRTLIDQAATKSGQTQAQLADDLGVKPARLSEWKSGARKPDANEIAYFAVKAKLPVLETVAEIEGSLSSRYAPIWQAALGKLRAAGVAATVTLTLLASLMMGFPTESQAHDPGGSLTSVSAKTKKPPSGGFFSFG
jgi:transcriptional regulator with XRE-family HTH domain